MILYVNPEDKEIAEKSLEEQKLNRRNPVLTVIAPLEKFYDAEE